MPLNEVGVDFAGANVSCVEDRDRQVPIHGRNTRDAELAERAGEPRDRLGARRRVRDHFREQRVVVDADVATHLDAAVVAQARKRRRVPQRDAAGRGQEVLAGSSA